MKMNKKKHEKKTYQNLQRKSVKKFTDLVKDVWKPATKVIFTISVIIILVFTARYYNQRFKNKKVVESQQQIAGAIRKSCGKPCLKKSENHS